MNLKKVLTGMILTYTVILLAACQPPMPQPSTSNVNQDLVGTIVAATLTAFPTSPPVWTDPQTSLSISMTYYSNQFTNINLQSRTIDYAVLHEMDEIVQSLRLASIP